MSQKFEIMAGIPIKNRIKDFQLKKGKSFENFFDILGSVSVRDIRKDVPILQVGGSTPFPPTMSAIRVLLLHTEEIVQGLLDFTVPTTLQIKNIMTVMYLQLLQVQRGFEMDFRYDFLEAAVADCLNQHCRIE